MSNEFENKKETKSLNFIEQIVENDLATGVNDGRLQTRFPPEPNGYLHIGHAKAICMDFGIAQKYGGICNLRFDDTNPGKEEEEYVNAIKRDIHWLGYEWNDVFFASDYFDQLWQFAERLINEGKAYIDEQTAEQIAEQKGTPTTAGVDSPYRNRPISENLELFRKMNSGELSEGSMVLRAKIDMTNSNMHFRDPIIYRIIKHPHHRTGTKWNAYPMYDFAHGQCDYFEGVTHSICTLEFVPHRPLYDYFIEELRDGEYRPHQYEFNRLSLTYTVLSKRNLLALVQENLVSGWDDPRMPTIAGLKRRGYTPNSIKKFMERIGYTKYMGLNDIGLLEFSVREDLNEIATRVSVVLDPIKLIITNYPEGQTEIIKALNNPERPEDGEHDVLFSRELYIEKSDYMENPPKKYFRLSPNKEVRLKNGYIITCTGAKYDDKGNILEVYATYDPETKSGMPGSAKKVKGTIHYVSCEDAVDAEVRLYDRLFIEEDVAAYPNDFRDIINPNSIIVVKGCKAESYLKNATLDDRFQFQRTGYFCLDQDSQPNNLVFNRTVALKDSWQKEKTK